MTEESSGRCSVDSRHRNLPRISIITRQSCTIWPMVGWPGSSSLRAAIWAGIVKGRLAYILTLRNPIIRSTAAAQITRGEAPARSGAWLAKGLSRWGRALGTFIAADRQNGVSRILIVTFIWEAVSFCKKNTFPRQVPQLDFSADSVGPSSPWLKSHFGDRREKRSPLAALASNRSYQRDRA